MAPILIDVDSLQSSLHRSVFSKGNGLGTRDTCVNWDSLNVRDVDSSQIIISTAVDITCHDDDEYEFDIMLGRSSTKSLADMSVFFQIQHSMYNLSFSHTMIVHLTDKNTGGLDLSEYLPPVQSSWAYKWIIPDDLRFDPQYGYQISFTDGQNHTVASSPMFSAQGHSSVVPVSPSAPQYTTSSTSTISTSSTSTTDAVPTQSAGASHMPSPADPVSSMGLSKGALAGLAAAVTALVVILIVAASKFLLKLKERQQRAREERTESPMLFWDKTPSASRLKIPSAEPKELEGFQSLALNGRENKKWPSERSFNSGYQGRLMSGCWPDQPWVPRQTTLPML